MQQVKVIVTVRQGRSLPIVGLACSLSDRPDAGQFGTTDSNGMLSAHFPGGSQVRFSVLSKKMNAHKYIGTLQLGPDSIAEQHFTAVVDLIKLEADTQLHPSDSQQTVYPDMIPPRQPTNRSPEGSNKQHPQGVSAASGADAQGNPETKVDAQNATLISLEQMQKMWPLVKSSKHQALQDFASELNTNLAQYKLDTPLRKAHFFAQVMQELGGAFEPQESLNYAPTKTPIMRHGKPVLDVDGQPKMKKGLIQIFSYFADHPDEAYQYGRTKDHAANEQEIAVRAYANRLGNGDVASRDGWAYRGRGCLQITGRKGYRAFTQSYKEFWPGEAVDFERSPDMLSLPKYQARSGVWFWLHNNLYLIADKGFDDSSVDSITTIVNKNTDSYGSRKNNFKLTWAIFR